MFEYSRSNINGTGSNENRRGQEYMIEDVV